MTPKNTDPRPKSETRSPRILRQNSTSNSIALQIINCCVSDVLVFFFFVDCGLPEVVLKIFIYAPLTLTLTLRAKEKRGREKYE